MINHLWTFSDRDISAFIGFEVLLQLIEFWIAILDSYDSFFGENDSLGPLTLIRELLIFLWRVMR